MVDPFENTNVPGIYAIGDVTSTGYELTPVAIAAGRRLADRLFLKEIIYIYRHYHIVLCILQYYIILYYIILYYTILYCIVLYCIVLYCIVLYCIVLYCIVLYCIVLYCIILYILYYYCQILV